MAEQSLDQILDGEEPQAPEADKAEEVVDEAAGVKTAESGSEEPEADPEASPAPEEPSEEDKPLTRAEIGAVLGERERRQKAERERDELRQRLEAQAEQKIDPIDDPEGYAAQMEQRLKAMEFNIERKVWKRTVSDWDEAETWINEQISNNEAIKAKLAGSDSILEDAYQLYEQHKKLEELQKADPEALKAQLRAEILAELEGEQTVKAEKRAEKEGALKPSLAAVGNSDSEQVIEDDFEDILGSDANNRKR